MNQQRANYLFFILMLLQATLLKAQELLPFVENFTKTEYNGDNQVWNITQGNDNALYFANNHYLIRYNGVRWEKYTLPNKTIIRSVFSDGDRIYTGSYNEIGYWKRKKGKLYYTSLTQNTNLFKGNSVNEEIWKIFKHNNTIYFQSFNELFLLINNKLQKIRIPFQISYCFVVNNKILVASVKDGVFEYSNNQFKPIPKWNLLKNNIIHSIGYHNNTYYFFTNKNGVFIEKNNTLVPWQHELNNFFKRELIITAKFANKNRLAIGTAFKGLYIVDLKDSTFINISRENSLKNNSILTIGFDKEMDIWLGLDNGISHIEINSPYHLFTDNSGILGSVYTLSQTNKGYLLGSNHGVFEYYDKKLHLLPNSQGQVWDISKIKNKYIIGHNDGTFSYENGQLNKENPISGGWKFIKSNFTDYYLQANYSGIIIYKNPLDLQNYKIVSHLTKPIKNIAQNKPDEVWAVDNYRSLYRIKFDENMEVIRVDNISQKEGIKNDFGVKLFHYRDELLFYIDNEWYEFNSIKDTLEKHIEFNKNFSHISEIIPVDENNFIVLKDKLLYIIHHKNNKYIWELLPEKYYKGRLINSDLKVFKDGEHYLMNLDDGFFSFKLSNEKLKKQEITVEGYYENQLINSNTKVKYNQSVEIDVLTPYFGYNRKNLFYKINESNTLIPINNGTILLNNLLSGTQTIEIYYNNGEHYKLLHNYTFNVEKPWYFSLWMILVYLLVIALMFYLYYKWNKIRYLQKLKLNEEELKHQKEILRLELDAQNKLRLQEYEKHILEVQIQAKASEVAGKSLSIAKQSEMIESILKILDSENDINSLKSSIKKSIKTNALNKNEWQNFEKNLLQSNEEFVQKLNKKFPTLTPKDIKLCIYLKMNLSSKEIAPLMNISFRGVELHRYRLRKKLGLNGDDSLSKFMISL